MSIYPEKLTGHAERRLYDISKASVFCGELIVCDISDPEQCENIAKKTVETFGKIDILLHVAAILGEFPFLEISVEQWRRTIDVNLNGTFFVCRAVLPTMIEQKSGNIIFCTAGYLRQHQPRSAAYSASKAGEAMLARIIASEFCKQGIRCNAFYPGPTLDTPGAKASNTPPEVVEALAKSIPLGRIGAVDECVGTTVFLASDESKFITGQMIAVDGGMTMT